MSDSISARADVAMRLYELEDADGWRELIWDIPKFLFPSNCQVRLIPPFGGEMIRFQVFDKDNDDVVVSVYLDTMNLFGYWEGPYWEIYPYQGDVWRCDMDKAEDLINAIGESLKEQRSND